MLAKRLLTSLIVCAQLVPFSWAGDQAAGGAAQGQPLMRTLRLRALQGDGAINNIRTGASTIVVIEVRDQNDQPVEGAEIVFELPVSGPSGVFASGSLIQTTKTNFQGQASSGTFRPNDQTGDFDIKVTATSGNQTGSHVVTQSNSESGFASEAPPRRTGLTRKWWFWSALAGGVGGALYYFISRERNIVLTPGPVVIGNPR